MRINPKKDDSIRNRDIVSSFSALLKSQGIEPDKFYEILFELVKRPRLNDARIEISGSENTYPINPGRLVLVADHNGEMKKSEDDARQFFDKLKTDTGLNFNDATYFGDEKQPMYSAYAIGNRTSGDGKDTGCLLVVVKGKKLEERVQPKNTFEPSKGDIGIILKINKIKLICFVKDHKINALFESFAFFRTIKAIKKINKFVRGPAKAVILVK